MAARLRIPTLSVAATGGRNRAESRPGAVAHARILVADLDFQPGEETMAGVDNKTSSYQDIALLIARVLVGALFIIAAYNKFKGYDGTIAYFTRLGVPAPSIVAPLAELFEVVAGVLLIIGYQTRVVALALGAFVLVATLFAHTNFADGNQLNHFLKNAAIVGGCLALFVTGAGAHSLDARRGG
jgi:putative oxidoreductase